MNTINIQFHILPKELIGFIENWTKEYDFRVVVIKLFPFSSQEIKDFVGLKDSETELNQLKFIYLGKSSPDLSESDNYAFTAKNPNYLSIHLGKLTNEGLIQSSVGGITDNLEYAKIWRKIIKNIRKNTSTGLWIVNPNINVKEFDKNARFSNGAYDLAKEGVKLLQIAGWNYYVVGEH